ncbi:hypothetical protein AVEN_252754-1, partial [Araneus ventricosus]
ERESLNHPRSPTYLHLLHFSIYGPAVQVERLDIQNSWISISKLSITLFQFSSVSHIHNRFWRGAAEFACSGALVNAHICSSLERVQVSALRNPFSIAEMKG